jgi:NAD+ diphosphatase
MPTSGELSRWRSCPRCSGDLEHGEGSVSCEGCGLHVYAGPAPTASALVIDDDGRVLLARRARDPGAGLFDLPGGFIDEGESALETLGRELREEAGVEVEPDDFLAGLPDCYGGDGVWTINFYWTARIVSGEPEPADDVADLVWFRRDELPARDEFAFANTVEALERWGGKFSPPSPKK